MPDSPDQHLINELYRKLNGEPSNGNGRHKHAPSSLSDDQVTELCRKAKNAAKFASLFDDGDLGDYSSASEADMALLSIMAFYSQDFYQLDRLYRQSQLMRPKWERSDYRMRTLNRVLENLTESYQQGDGARLKTHEGGDSFAFTSYRVGVPNESFSLPFRTAKQISEETPADTEWLVFPYLAKGTVTEVAGAIKKSGKTTFLTCLSRKVLDGEPFMGGRTIKTSVLFLTEQGPSSFRKALKTAGLEDREDFHVLYWHDAIGAPWPDVMRMAEEFAHSVGAGLIIVDVISRWVGLEGDSENSAGAATEAMRPLKEAAGRGLTVAYARHDRKGGGDVGESGRGSSQFGGDVDQMLHLKRPEGNMRNTIRVLETIGRFMDDTPESVSIEFVPERGEYTCLGESGAVAEQEAMRTICDLLPATRNTAWETTTVVEEVGKQNIKRSACINSLNKLTEAGTIKRLGEGKKGSPHRYYKLLPEDLEEEGKGTEKHLFKTPTPREQTQNKTTEDDPRAQKLINEGMSEKFARAELGQDT